MNFAPMVVNLLGLKINSMDRSATLALGPIQQASFYHSNKRNQGFGEQNGDLNAINIPLNYLIDTDLIDSPSQKTGIL